MLARYRKNGPITPHRVAAWAVRSLFGLAVEHHVTDRVLNVPSPLWSPPHPWRCYGPERGREPIRQLRRDGAVTLPEFVGRDELARIHDALERQFAPALSPR